MAEAIDIHASVLKVIHETGLTYKHLSKMAGIPPSTMHQYLNGEFDLNGKRLNSILTALGFSLIRREGGDTLVQRFKGKLPKKELDRIEVVLNRRKQIASKRDAEAAATQRDLDARKKLFGSHRPKHIRTHQLGDDDKPKVRSDGDVDPLD
jgi:transcriptional regulator with XRE-family HTH domain